MAACPLVARRADEIYRKLSITRTVERTVVVKTIVSRAVYTITRIRWTAMETVDTTPGAVYEN